MIGLTLWFDAQLDVAVQLNSRSSWAASWASSLISRPTILNNPCSTRYIASRASSNISFRYLNVPIEIELSFGNKFRQFLIRGLEVIDRQLTGKWSKNRSAQFGMSKTGHNRILWPSGLRRCPAILTSSNPAGVEFFTLFVSRLHQFLLLVR